MKSVACDEHHTIDEHYVKDELYIIKEGFSYVPGVVGGEDGKDFRLQISDSRFQIEVVDALWIKGHRAASGRIGVDPLVSVKSVAQSAIVYLRTTRVSGRYAAQTNQKCTP